MAPRLKGASCAHITAVMVTVRGSHHGVVASDVVQSGDYPASVATPSGIGSFGRAQVVVIYPGSVERSRAGCS